MEREAPSDSPKGERTMRGVSMYDVRCMMYDGRWKMSLSTLNCQLSTLNPKL
ncbi:MAG: hypothetical protein K6A93_10920 [Bacteroidaceae bacterium]|nr:hypothetical protein [Bacteroidaceae bacterium]